MLRKAEIIVLLFSITRTNHLVDLLKVVIFFGHFLGSILDDQTGALILPFQQEGFDLLGAFFSDFAQEPARSLMRHLFLIHHHEVDKLQQGGMRDVCLQCFY